MIKIKKLFLGWGALVLILSSCKATKTAEGTAAESVSTTEHLLANYRENLPRFENLEARLKGNFDNGKSNQSANLNLRIKKNDTIWINVQKLGFSVARLLVTPNRVQFYERINGQYFDGDFRLLSDWLGVELDFEKFQRLLVGELLSDIHPRDFNFNWKENTYELQAKNNKNIHETIQIDAKNFRPIGEKLRHSRDENKGIEIHYPSYLAKGEELFPEVITITGHRKNRETRVNLVVRSIEINENVGFPFRIPDNYEEILIDL